MTVQIEAKTRDTNANGSLAVRCPETLSGKGISVLPRATGAVGGSEIAAKFP